MELLRISERKLKVMLSDEDIVSAGLAVADGSMKYEGLLEWIRGHRI